MGEDGVPDGYDVLDHRDVVLGGDHLDLQGNLIVTLS